MARRVGRRRPTPPRAAGSRGRGHGQRGAPSEVRATIRVHGRTGAGPGGCVVGRARAVRASTRRPLRRVVPAAAAAPNPHRPAKWQGARALRLYYFTTTILLGDVILQPHLRQHCVDQYNGRVLLPPGRRRLPRAPRRCHWGRACDLQRDLGGVACERGCGSECSAACL